jgi:hypothetical protein
MGLLSLSNLSMSKPLNALSLILWMAYLSEKPIEVFLLHIRILPGQDLQGRILESMIPYFKSADYLLIGCLVLTFVCFLRKRLQRQRTAIGPASFFVLQRRWAAIAMTILVVIYSVTLWLDPAPSLPLVFAVIWIAVLARDLVRVNDIPAMSRRP